MSQVRKFVINSHAHRSASNFVGHHSGCGINDDISQWMDSVQNSADTSAPPPQQQQPSPTPLPQPKPQAAPLKGTQQQQRYDDSADEFRQPHEKYSAAANRRQEDEIIDGYADGWHAATTHDRARRAPPPPQPTRSKEENKNTCSLYIQTDPLIWRHIREGIADVSNSQTQAILQI